MNARARELARSFAEDEEYAQSHCSFGTEWHAHEESEPLLRIVNTVNVTTREHEQQAHGAKGEESTRAVTDIS